MASGTVKWYDKGKGYGFIRPDESPGDGRDVFVHVTAVEEAGYAQLYENQRVSFDVTRDRKKRQCAENVKLI